MDTIDGLPPEARLLLRALHAGLPLPDAAALLALDEADAAKRLRAALVRAGESAPAASAGGAALVAAAAPLVELAGRPPVRAPATACLPPAVAGALAAGDLAGPLLLASAEHVADCRACLDRVLTLRRSGAGRSAAPPPRRRRRGGIVVAVVLVVGLAAIAAALWSC